MDSFEYYYRIYKKSSLINIIKSVFGKMGLVYFVSTLLTFGILLAAIVLDEAIYGTVMILLLIAHIAYFEYGLRRLYKGYFINYRTYLKIYGYNRKFLRFLIFKDAINEDRQRELFQPKNAIRLIDIHLKSQKNVFDLRGLLPVIAAQFISGYAIMFFSGINSLGTFETVFIIIVMTLLIIVYFVNKYYSNNADMIELNQFLHWL